MRRRSGILLLASALFVASGALGLGYQLVWIKKATLLVGSSQMALSTVVASFFLGLALGSLFVGRYLRSRRWSPLAVYAGFEACIGIFALAFPLLFGAVESLYSALFPWVSASDPALFAVRFTLLFLLFLLPTFLMGGTLPLLLDGLVERDRNVGSLTSLLYGLNIVGAVCGVLLTGYWAVPELGINGTSSAAGIGNLCIGAIAFLAFRATPPLHPLAASRAEPAAYPSRVFVVLSFLSGFAALGYEIAWARHFSLVTPSSVYFTSVLLAVYLLGLAAGSLLLAQLLRRGLHPLRVLALSQPLVPPVVFALLTAWLLAYRPYRLSGSEARYTVLPQWALFADNFDALLVAPVLQVAFVLFLPAMLIGAGLPGLIAAATRSSQALRSTSGTLVFWNTIGSSAGGFLAGYALLPGLGLTRTLLALSAITVSIGMLSELLLAREESGRRRGGFAWLLRPGIALGIASLAFVGLSARRDVTRQSIMAYGAGNGDGNLLVDVKEGPFTTAFVIDRKEERLLGSGNVLLAVVPHRGISLQALQGSLPMLFYPRPGTPRDVLGIALGSGQSFGSLLLHPIEHLDVVDISAEIVELSLRHFGSVQHGLGSDPRVSFHLDDGRHFVARAKEASYDMVTSEPPPPTDAGVHVLYSLEFYQQVERILRDGGMLVSWLPLYRVTPRDVLGMLETQAAVFPYTFVFRGGPIDFFILSLKLEEPPLFRRAWFEERLRRFSLERGVAGFRWPGPPTSRFRLDSIEGVIATLMTGPEDIDALDFPLVHREDDQALSYSSGDRELLRRYQNSGRLERLAFSALPLTRVERLQQYFDWPLPVEEIEEDRARVLRHRFGVPSPRALRDAVSRWEREPGGSARAAIALEIAQMYDGQLSKDEAYLWLGRAIAEGAPSPTASHAARKIAAHGIGVYSEMLRSWLESSEVPVDGSPPVAAMREELAEFDDWDGRRRSRFWFE